MLLTLEECLRRLETLDFTECRLGHEQPLRDGSGTILVDSRGNPTSSPVCPDAVRRCRPGCAHNEWGDLEEGIYAAMQLGVLGTREGRELLWEVQGTRGRVAHLDVGMVEAGERYREEPLLTLDILQELPQCHSGCVRRLRAVRDQLVEKMRSKMTA